MSTDYQRTESEIQTENTPLINEIVANQTLPFLHIIGQHNITISNNIFQEWDLDGSTRDTMLYIENSTNIIIENNEFLDSTGRIIEVVNSSDIQIRNNYLQGFNRSFNGLIIDGSENVWVENNTFESHVQAIIIVNSEEINVISNIIHDNTIGIVGIGIGSTNIIHNNISFIGNMGIYVSSTSLKGIITISDNYIIDAYINGITLLTDIDVIITNNELVNTNEGIGIMNFHDVNINIIVENNEISQTNDNGISVSIGENYISIKNNTIIYKEDGIFDNRDGILVIAGSGIISDNYIENYPDGIYLGAAKNLIVSNNKLTNIRDNAIWIYNSENITVLQNSIINTDRAIYVHSSDNIFLIDNLVSDSKYGVYISESKNIGINNNTFTNTDTIIRTGISFLSVTGEGNYQDGSPYTLPSKLYRILFGSSILIIIVMIALSIKYPDPYKKILGILNKKI